MYISGCLRLFLNYEIRICPQLLLMFRQTYAVGSQGFLLGNLFGGVCVFSARLARLILTEYSCFKARLK